MIFVTVGTHEQQFNRLLETIDRLKGEGVICEDVVVQTGYSTYQPKHCKWFQMLTYQDMCKNVAEARIVITHGGPSSFIMPLQQGKVPIVVPRQKIFGEHVNDHQLTFARKMVQQQKNILLVENVDLLKDMICNYDVITEKMQNTAENNNAVFCRKLEKMVRALLSE